MDVSNTQRYRPNVRIYDNPASVFELVSKQYRNRKRLDEKKNVLTKHKKKLKNLENKIKEECTKKPSVSVFTSKKKREKKIKDFTEAQMQETRRLSTQAYKIISEIDDLKSDIKKLNKMYLQTQAKLLSAHEIKRKRLNVAKHAVRNARVKAVPKKVRSAPVNRKTKKNKISKRKAKSLPCPRKKRPNTRPVNLPDELVSHIMSFHA